MVLPGPGNDVAFGNVDFDANPEIVVAGTSATYVYDAATLELQWTAGYGGSAVFIADVDGDARNEDLALAGGAILEMAAMRSSSGPTPAAFRRWRSETSTRTPRPRSCSRRFSAAR